ncbi:MAG: DUF5677 domain-containing protein [Thermodesulfovibrionales bacterium]
MNNDITLDVLRSLDDFFQKQLSLAKELSRASSSTNSKQRINELYPLFDSLQTSGNSIILLTRSGFMTESYIIARAFLERIVNLCYLIVCENKVFEDYIDFSMQKVYRSLHSHRKAFENMGEIVTVPDLSKIPIVDKGLNKFTSKRGKEITRWTELRIDKRIETVGEKVVNFSVPTFLAAYHHLYEDASEAVHGTLYGALFHTGIFYGAQDPEQGEKYLNSMRISMYLLLGLLVEGLLHSAHTEIDSENLIAKSKKNFKELHPTFAKMQKIL